MGLCFGSFLNVVIDRLPVNESLLRPPSHCPECGKRLTGKDLIPLISYLWLRGRCRYCGSAIPQRIFWIELITGVSFALLAWKYGLSAELGVFAVYTCVLIAIFVIDMDHQLILNKITYPAIVFALATVPLRPQITFVDAFIAGAIGFGLLFLVVVISRGGMGWGDVKFAAFMGLATGFPIIFVALFVGVVTGGIFAIGLLALKRKGRKQAIPFGPFLVIGTIVALMWGNTMWEWYMP